jgi:imidazolonepropionase-like amidohydrolase
MPRTIFCNANLIDGLNAARRGDVLVDGEKISAVAEPGSLSNYDAAEFVHDLDGKTLMPGMVAGHAHLSYHNLDPLNVRSVDMNYPGTYLAVAATRHAANILKAGFTSAIGAGVMHNIDVILKQLIQDGLAIGPRLVASGRDMCATGHPLDWKPHFWNMPSGALSAICDGPNEFRKAVREEAKKGVEIIKLYPEGGHGVPTSGSRLTYEEIATVVETAKLCDMRVRAHAYSKPVIKACVKAGVSVIDHGDHMDEELIDLFVENGTFVLPSLALLKEYVGIFHSQQQCDEWFAYARKSLALGVKAGVRFVSGDDVGIIQWPHGENAREFKVYVNDLGIDPLEVIKWATFNGAAMMGRADLGQIAAGKLADVVIVDGDPLADIAVLADPSKIAMVMQGGNVISSRLTGTAETERAVTPPIRDLEDVMAASYGGPSARQKAHAVP